MKLLKRELSNTIPNTELWTVQPDEIGCPLLVTVSKPIAPHQPGQGWRSAASPEGGWHGVIVTDGNLWVGTLAHGCAFMGMGREMPAAVAVSVGYPFDHPLPVNMARTTQLTPTAWPKWDAAVGALFGGEAAPSGGADGFVSFLSDELMPMIESEVGVNSSEWTLAGHSLGGLFTTHALLSRPGRWRRHLAISPSYWWHKHVLLDRVREFAAVPALLPVSVYLAAGDQETTEKTTQAWHPWMRSDSWRQYLEVMGGVPDLVKDARLVADLLAQRWGVRVRCDVLNEETHQSSPFAAMSRGLRWLHEV